MFWKKSTKLGYTIFAENGTKSNLCFQSYYYPDVKLKTYFHIDYLIKFLLKKIATEKEDIQRSEDLITSTNNVQYYKDLFIFEYTSDYNTFQESMNAWYLLLTPLIHVDKDILKQVLLP